MKCSRKKKSDITQILNHVILRPMPNFNQCKKSKIFLSLEKSILLIAHSSMSRFPMISLVSFIPFCLVGGYLTPLIDHFCYFANLCHVRLQLWHSKFYGLLLPCFMFFSAANICIIHAFWFICAHAECHVLYFHVNSSPTRPTFSFVLQL